MKEMGGMAGLEFFSVFIWFITNKGKIKWQ